METNIETLKSRIKELIGVEPEHLHHVLQAIHTVQWEKNGRHRSVCVRDDGEIYEIYMSINKCNWDLTKDLSGQSEETISFLNELIK